MERRTDWDKIQERKVILLIWIFTIFLLLFSLLMFSSTQPITVHFISITQGDACLIRAGRGGTVLIDGGDVGTGTTLENYFAIQNVRQLDAVFVSHFHQDHISGIIELLESDFPISQIYISQHPSHTEFEDELLHITKEKDIPVTRLKESQELILGKATYRVISQEPYKSEAEFNNMSMILRMDYKSNSFLFTGDIEKDASERLVAQKNSSLDVDVLKIPHHGGASSASGDLLSATTPEYSVISIGQEDQYGNPADITLAYLLRTDSKIYRTDRDGTITMTLGKTGIKNISYSKQWR